MYYVHANYMYYVHVLTNSFLFFAKILNRYMYIVHVHKI